MNLLSSLYKAMLWLLLLILPFSFISAQQVWQQTNSEIDYPIYKFTSHQDQLYAAFYGAGVYKTADEGENWIACHNGLTNFLARDVVTLGNTLFVGTNRGGVFKSLDGGETWQATSEEGLNQDIWSLFAANNRLFAGTARGLYFTDDAGNTWQKADLPRPKAHHQIIFSLALKGDHILAGSNRYVYLSKDFGETWEQIKVPTNLDIMTIRVQNDVWLLGTSGDGIIASQDGMEWHAWNKESGNTRSLILVEENVVLGSAIQGILSVENNIDGSENIQTLNEGFATPAVRSVGYHNGKMYAGTYKQGIWRYDVPNPNLLPSILNGQRATQSVQIYPNPTSNGWITLEYELTEDSPTHIDLFDAFGKRIAQIVPPTEQFKGTHNLNYDLSHLSGGVYYFHLQLGDEKVAKQIILHNN